MRLIGSQLLLAALLAAALAVALNLYKEPERLIMPGDVSPEELAQLFPRELMPANLEELRPARRPAEIPAPPEPTVFVGYRDTTGSTIFAAFTAPGMRAAALRADISARKLCERYEAAVDDPGGCPVQAAMPVLVGNAAVARTSSGNDEVLLTQVFMRSGIRVGITIHTSEGNRQFLTLMPALAQEIDRRLIALVEAKIGATDD